MQIKRLSLSLTRSRSLHQIRFPMQKWFSGSLETITMWETLNVHSIASYPLERSHVSKTRTAPHSSLHPRIHRSYRVSDSASRDSSIDDCERKWDSCHRLRFSSVFGSWFSSSSHLGLRPSMISARRKCVFFFPLLISIWSLKVVIGIWKMI